MERGHLHRQKKISKELKFNGGGAQGQLAEEKLFKQNFIRVCTSISGV